MALKSPIRKIEGRHHPLVKEVRSLARSGRPLGEGLVLLETVRLVQDAVKSGAGIAKVFISRECGPAAKAVLEKIPPETQAYEVAPEIFELLASTRTSQGIVALVSPPQWKEKDLFVGKSPILLVLAGIQDPGNMGAILRSAEAFGVSGMILTKGTVGPYNSKVIRAAAGSLLRIPVLRDLSVPDVLALLQRHRVRLLAGVVSGGTLPPAIDFKGPIAIAVGSEGAGLPEELEAAGQRFTIPIASRIESLNVAAATAVILYEIARQRSLDGSR